MKRLYLARPVDPVLIRHLAHSQMLVARLEHDPRGDLAVFIEETGRFEELVRGATGIVGQTGFVRLERDVEFVTTAVVMREEEERRLAIERRAREAVERADRIRADSPICLASPVGAIDALLHVRAQRFSEYRRAFGTNAVDGTTEPAAEAASALAYHIEHLRLQLPFATSVFEAINTFRGGWTDGSNHIAPTKPLAYGRLRRDAGAPLCRPPRTKAGKRRRFFDLRPTDEPASCVACARLAERIISR